MNKAQNNKLYIEENTKQEIKANNSVCGDYYCIKYSSDYTVHILCDGIGSGIKASIAATMTANRISKLIEAGFSLSKIACEIANLMHRARTESIPFSTFTITKILNSGQFYVLNFENPLPLLLSGQECIDLEADYISCEYELVAQISGRLREKDALFICSDGISQAGLGKVPAFGWGRKNVKEYLHHLLQKGLSEKEILAKTFGTVKSLSGANFTDDVTATILSARKARVLNLISGPPSKKDDDARFIRDFISQPGKKAVCGSTTANIVANELKREVETFKVSSSFARPPHYKIKGIDIVTEGAVTLNQVYNIIDRDPATYDEESCVSKLAKSLLEADYVKIFWGQAKNKAHQDTSFIQMGILARNTILPLLINKLEKLNKTVELVKL